MNMCFSGPVNRSSSLERDSAYQHKPLRHMSSNTRDPRLVHISARLRPRAECAAQIRHSYMTSHLSRDEVAVGVPQLLIMATWKYK